VVRCIPERLVHMTLHVGMQGDHLANGHRLFLLLSTNEPVDCAAVPLEPEPAEA
jgi:hypothetical protein